MADASSEPPPTLGEMFITSVDTLEGKQIDLRVALGWNDRPPLLVEKGSWRKRERPEDPALLKGMLRKGIPPVLRCAVWLSNIIATVHPHQPPEYSQEYRTLAKVRALDLAYQNLLQRTISSKDSNIHDETTWKDLNTPNFGNNLEKFLEPTITVKRVMIGVDQVLGVIEYSPILPTLCELLLSHMSESYVFCALREMAHAPNWYFPTYRREYAAWVNAFCDILERLHPTTANFYKLHGVWNVPGMAPIFRDFFTDLLPKEYVLRILDIYTLEGSKVIFRFGVALLVLFKMDQSSNGSNNRLDSSDVFDSTRSVPEIELTGLDSNKDGDNNNNDDEKEEDVEDQQQEQEDEDFDVWEALKLWTHDERFNFEFLVKKAYGVHGQRRPRRFPRRNIMARIIKMEEERLLNDPSLDTSDVAPSRPLGITEPFVHPELDRDELGNYDKKPPDVVMAQPTVNRVLLASWLPLSLRMTKLELLFSTNHHGRTLDMFYTRVKDFKHTVLLAEVFVPGSHTGTSNGGSNGNSNDGKTIIGCYASQAWRASNQVYGDGECILFRLAPDPKSWKWNPRNKEITLEEDGGKTNGSASGAGLNNNSSHNNTALLEQFMVGTQSYISMGGNPDGSCGLRFNEDFTRAESSPAVGFDNEPLAGIKGDLDIGLVEVYGLKRPT
ncbi:domain family member 24 [Seminavis robusta]|uniref:Oxidation resistance protein 1 n=1 Tax=Seminavis robusta TaxID=568900 RepID=A0A9N8D7Y3_9STRA|nr:domain family member 24 [Seminavis robusta]|eukprot:Sro25_g016970.1 domain family member 24 (668) ;mRNA; r:82655-84756